MPRYHATPNGLVQFTSEEETKRDAELKSWNDASATRKLAQIKSLRLEKLIETDYLAMSDNVLSDEMKAFRKKMRDIPQNFNSSKYNELLNRDTDGNLTHSVWSKP